ncbi:kinase-like protein, partial [Serendipita vermifera]
MSADENGMVLKGVARMERRRATFADKDDAVEQPHQVDDPEPINIWDTSIEPVHGNQISICLDLQQEEDPISRVVPRTVTPLPPATEETHSYEPPDLTDQVVQTSPYPVFEGTFSNVFTGNWNGHKVAIKVIRGRLNREIQVWGSLIHCNILPLYGQCENFGEFGALISPWYANGDVGKCIRRHALNVLIDDDGHARLCDFGLVRSSFAEHTTTAHVGTLRYRARELVNKEDILYEDEQGIVTTTSDMYAVGCMALE